MANYVLEILKEFLIWKELKARINYEELSYNKQGELRLVNDNDSKYYYKVVGLSKEDALRGDTIVSFWTPYRQLLKMEANWNTSKSIGHLKSLIYQIETNRKTDFNEKIKEVNRKVEEFAKIYYTQGNYMLLPHRKMNKKRYHLSEDRIDLTLYECFEKGKLYDFFGNEDIVKKWIEEQNLTKVFLNRDICKCKIDWFVKEGKTKLISEMTKDEIYEYLEKGILLINERNK